LKIAASLPAGGGVSSLLLLGGRFGAKNRTQYQSGASMTSRRSFRVALAGVALSGLAACAKPSPALNPDGSSTSLAAEGSNAALPTGTLSTRFAGVMPRGLTTVGAATLGNALYLVGGYFGVPHDYSKEFQSGQVLRLDLSSGEWRQVAGVAPVQSAAVAADGKYLYEIGGTHALNAAGQPTDLRSVAEAARFDPALDRWEPLPPLPEGRSSHYAVVVDHTLYVVGGWTLAGGMNDNTWLDTMLTLDLSQPTLRWNSLKVPFQVRAQGLVASNGKLWVLGGIAPEGGTDAVHRYDIQSGQWSDGPALPEENLTTRGAAYKGRLYANGANGSIYRLSEDEARWEKAGAVEFPRLFHEIVESEQGPLVLAGIPDNGRGGRVRVIERLSDEPAPAGVVLQLANASPAKNRQGVFMWGQQLFVFGGNNSLGQHDFEAKNFSSAAWRLDLGALEWRALPDFPAARQSMQALVVGKEEEAALAFGGFGFLGDTLSTHAEVFRHDIMKKEWTPLGDKKLPEGRSQFGVAQWKEAVWVFGGMSFDGHREQQDQIHHTTQVLKLDLSRPDAKFEDAGVALSEPRRAFAGALEQGTYYLVGGLRENFQMVQSCEAIELDARKRRPITCPSEHRLGAELVAIGGKLYLVGGSVAAAANGERQPTPRVEVYDPQSDRWAVLPAPIPLDTADQLRAFNYKDQLLLYSAQRSDGNVQVALLDPAALAAGRQDFTRIAVSPPAQ
jgi:N-acetylneuraminic acid mutarotase